MASYLQMGHDTQNLVGESGLENYKGIILSPVNRTKSDLEQDIPKFREKNPDFDIMLDPQFYMPRIDRGKLGTHPYFPLDIDTVDLSSFDWWKSVCDKLNGYAVELSVNSLATPAQISNNWKDEYYLHCNEVSNYLVDLTDNLNIYSTVLVPLSELVDSEYVLKISSMISVSKAFGYYIIFVSDKDPRRELDSSNELLGAMNLIRYLTSTEKPICIGYCSSEFILYKAAGATICSSGKFFNLRRFTKSRFEEPNDGGGGQLPYFLEEGLLGFLRDADILRLSNSDHSDILFTGSSNNLWSDKILENLKSEDPKAWLAYSWRQYLTWFANTEALLDIDDSSNIVSNMLKLSENNWLILDDDNILFDEPRNNGKWVRPWRQALIDFIKK